MMPRLLVPGVVLSSHCLCSLSLRLRHSPSLAKNGVLSEALRLQGGVKTGLVASARQQLLQLLLLEVQEGLDTALKTRVDRNPSQRNVAIRAALDRAETLLDSELGSGATEELLLACKGADSDAGSSAGSEAEAAEAGAGMDSGPGSPRGSCSESDAGSKGRLSEGLAAKLEALDGSLVGNVRRLLGEADR